MKKNFRITQEDFLLANRRAAREEEIQSHGKQREVRVVGPGDFQNDIGSAVVAVAQNEFPAVLRLADKDGRVVLEDELAAFKRQIYTYFGTEFRTRSLVERLGASLVDGDEYMFDMSGIELISRSAADELYNIALSNHVELIRMTSFVQQMYDAVKLGRFQPRQHPSNDVEFIKCTDLQSLTMC